MQVVLRSDLADCFRPLGRVQDDFEFEVATVLLAFFVNFCPPQSVMIMLCSILACGPDFGASITTRSIVLAYDT